MAAILAQIDPVAAGYLELDSAGHLRLPVLRKLGDIDLVGAGQMSLLAEYTLHNLSDADLAKRGYRYPMVNCSSAHAGEVAEWPNAAVC